MTRRVDHAEAVARDDHEVGLAGARRGPARFVGRRLEGARRGGADRDHAAAAGPRPGHRLGGFGRDRRRAPGRPGGPRRLRPRPAGTCPGRRAARSRRARCPRSAKRLEERRREVQARGGRGDAARLARVDRLVALAVGGRVGAPDVRGSGTCPWRSRAAATSPVAGPGGCTGAGARLGTGRLRRASMRTLRSSAISTSVPGRRRRPGRTSASQSSPSSWWARTRSTSAAPPPARRPRSRAGKTRLRLTTSRSPGSQEVGQVAERVMADGSGGAIEDEKARGIALGKGLPAR